MNTSAPAGGLVGKVSRLWTTSAWWLKASVCGLLVVSALVLASASPMNLFGPSTYEDCILTNMRGVTSNLAAGQIRNACRQKFQDRGRPQSKSRMLREEELAKLTGKASFGFETIGSMLMGTATGNDVFKGSLHNGNSDLTVTEVVITISGKKDSTLVTRSYTAPVNLPPLSMGEFTIQTIPGEFTNDHNWIIQSARGH